MPRVCGMMVAPTGTSAWRRLLSVIVRPREANIARITSADRLVAHERRTPITAAIACAGQIVVGGPEATAHDDGVGVGEQTAQLHDDPLDVVADLDLDERVDAVRRELAADPRRVRIDDLAEQQLGPDGEDVTTHGGSASLGRVWITRRCPPPVSTRRSAASAGRPTGTGHR